MTNLRWIAAAGVFFSAAFCLTLTGAEAEEPGNLIKGDSSFETGSNALAASDFQSAELDNSSAWEGQNSLKLIGKGTAKLKTITVTPGQEYNFSVYAKGGEKKQAIGLCIYSFSLKDKASKSFPLTRDWQRFDISIKPTEKNYILSVQTGGPEACWIDACQFQKGATAAAYKNRNPVSSSINLDSKFNYIFLNGETVPFDVSMKKAWSDFATDNIQYQLEVKDYYGNIVKRDDIRVTFDKQGYCRIPYQFEAKKLGPYFLYCTLKKNNEVINEDTTSLAVVRKPVAIEEGLTPFCGIDTWEINPGHERIGVKWVEMMVKWPQVESNKGDFKWSNGWCPDKIFSYKKAGYKVKVMLSGIPPKWASEEPSESFAFPKDMEDWRNFVRKVVLRYKGQVDLWELGGEPDLVFGMSKYYRKMYPDAVIGGITAGKLAERYAEVIAVASKEIRQLDPGILIGGIRPGGMGGDFRAGYPFSIAIFKVEPKAFDLFPLDSYCNPRWIGPGRSPRANPEELIKQYKKAFEVSSKYGNGQKIYCSEMAYPLDPETDPNGEFAREQAEKLSRAFLVSRMTPNVEMFHYFAAGSEWGCKFDIWRDQHPLPAVAAYSNAAYVVENVRSSKEIEVADGAKAVVFGKKGLSIGAIWKYDASVELSYEAPRDFKHLEVFDMMGNTPPLVKGKYEVATSPIFFSSTDEDAFSKLAAYFASARTNIYPARLTARIPNNGHGVVSVSAVTPVKLEFDLEVNSGDTTLCRNSGVVEPGKNTDIEFDFPKDLFRKGGKLSARITPKGFETTSIDIPLDLNEIKKLDSPLSIDDTLLKTVPLKLFNQKSDIYPPDPWIQWSENDLSGRSYIGWDKNFFYFAVNVNDDTHSNSKSQLWEGDSVQFAFHIPTEKNTPGLNYGPDDFEFCMALVNGKPSIFQSVGRPVKGIECMIKRDDKSTSTDYLVKLPLSGLGLSSPEDAVIGFNYVVFDDDTGAGVAKWHMLTPGITEGKQPGLFKKFILSK